MSDDAGPNLYELIVHDTVDAIIYADHEGKIRLWNAAAASLFGFPAATAIGTSLDLIIPDRLRASHWAGYHKAMETGHTRLNGRPTLTRALHQDGRRLYVEMTFSVVHSPSGAVLGSVAVARDVTEKRLKETAALGAATGAPT